MNEPTRPDDDGVLARVAARLGLTEGQLWTIAVVTAVVILVLIGLRDLDTGAVS